MNIKKKSRLIIVLAVSGLFLMIFFLLGSESESNWQHVSVDVGRIEKKVSATGTLNPMSTVNVGTQISGIIEDVFVDFNDAVKKGELLAKVDSSLIDANLSQLSARLSAAAAVLKAAEARFIREKRLFAEGFISLGSLENSEKEFEEARSRLMLAKAELNREDQNLMYTRIISPIDGVVIEKKVDVGQTVAARFQTPTLFKIAGNLNFMQIEALVSEADIGNVKKGQSVRFSVDAYFGRVFEGVVDKVRLEPKVEQNVVNYVVVILVNNKEGILLPGMTAQASIVVESKENVLSIPLSALRFKPENKNLEFDKPKLNDNSSIVYLLGDNNKLVPTDVVLGIDDGKKIEVGVGLSKNDKVVLREIKKSKSKRSSFRFGVR